MVNLIVLTGIGLNPYLLQDITKESWGWRTLLSWRLFEW